MSLVDEKHEWPATKVRDTFLEYFKERGHTFGRSLCNSCSDLPLHLSELH